MVLLLQFFNLYVEGEMLDLTKEEVETIRNCLCSIMVMQHKTLQETGLSSEEYHIIKSAIDQKEELIKKIDNQTRNNQTRKQFLDTIQQQSTAKLNLMKGFMNNQQEATIGGVTYILTPKTAEENGLQYVLIRAKSAGVFVGYLQRKDLTEVDLVNSRRLHYWDGADSVSQIALEGVTEPQNCRFAMVVPFMTISEWIEIIPVTEVAKQNIAEVPIWKK